MSMNSTVLIPVPAATRPRRKWLSWRMAPVAALVLIVAVALVVRSRWGAKTSAIQGAFYTVVPLDLEIKISKDGELQAIEYTDVKSGVEGFSTILEIVKEGTTVKKGDKLVVLDSSNLVLRKEELDISLEKAESALKIAIEVKEIQESQNAANLEAADVALQLAKLSLEEWKDGTYPQQLQNAQTALKMANTMLTTKRDDLEQSQRLYAKGFVTAADVKKAELEVIQAENTVRKTEKDLEVLEKYQYKMEQTRLESAVAQALQRRARVLRENRSLLTQRLAEVAEKESYVNNLKERSQKLKEQIDACTITAPEAGLVIYASTIDRWGPSPIQEGAQIRERQWLLRLPDVAAMKATLRIPEAQIPRLSVEKKQRGTVKIVGVPRPVGATLTKVSVLADSSSRWWGNPDLKEYPVELTLDETPPGLKPGIGCQAEIFIDHYEHALAVPLAALYTVGKDSYVFVRNGDSVSHRKIAIGASNETHVQVTEGVAEGDDVLLLQPGQGRQLLEQAGIKVADPTTRPAQDNDRRNRRDRSRENASASAS